MTNEKSKLTKIEMHAILQSLGNGVVPKIGLEHIVVGRKEEIKQLLKELQDVKQGASGLKIIAGNYGSGKTFILRLIRGIALNQEFIVADVDLSQERRFTGSDNQGINLYRELVKNMATSVRPDNAIESIIEKWLSNVQSQVMKKRKMTRINYNDIGFVSEVETEVDEVLKELENLTCGFAFREVIKAYYRGYASDNEDLRRSALRWLRGEYGTRSESKKDLGIRDIITDDNWFEHLKLLGHFIKYVGYSGLIILFDETVNLYKISHTISRNKNFEFLLSMFNDLNQGGCKYLYTLLGSTKEMVHDERRGFYSYDALKSRLKSNQFEDMQYRDYSQPVIELTPLPPEHLLALLMKLRDIHEIDHGNKGECSNEEIQIFLKERLNRPGADRNISPRDIIRGFLDALNIIYHNPNMPHEKVFKESGQKERSVDDIQAEKSDKEFIEEQESTASNPLTESRFKHTK